MSNASVCSNTVNIPPLCSNAVNIASVCSNTVNIAPLYSMTDPALRRTVQQENVENQSQNQRPENVSLISP